MTTFAATTVNQSANTIAAIEAQIAQLQQQLTSLQEQRQAIKSAEQQGLSAISQYKQAIATIAALDEPEMLQQFLKKMATITSQALGVPPLPKATDDSPRSNPSSQTPSDVIDETVTDNHLNHETVTDDLHNNESSDDNHTDNRWSFKKWSLAERQVINLYKRTCLIQFCSNHGINFKPREKKAMICQRIEAENYKADYVLDWLDNQ